MNQWQEIHPWTRYWPYLVYVGVVAIVAIVVSITSYRAAFELFDGRIASRFNIYQGVTVIEQSTRMLQYIWLSIGISLMNIALATVIQVKHYANQVVRRTLTHWIFASTLICLSLIGYYVILVIEINQ